MDLVVCLVMLFLIVGRLVLNKYHPPGSLDDGLLVAGLPVGQPGTLLFVIREVITLCLNQLLTDGLFSWT